MASNKPTGPDSLITIKVALGGVNRRFKLPLRELGANMLPDKASRSDLPLLSRPH